VLSSIRGDKMRKGFKNRKYTQEEEKFLLENYAKLGNKKCAEILDRTKSALNHKIKKMGLNIDWGYQYKSKEGYLVDCTQRLNRKLVHRQVMEQKLNRPLTSQDIVHHKDGNKLNNHPDNLELLTRAQHINLHRPELEEGVGYWWWWITIF
jgi:hypothetical protein